MSRGHIDEFLARTRFKALDYWELSVRSRRCLREAGINTVEELERLCDKPPDYYKVLALDGIGRISAYEIITAYTHRGTFPAGVPWHPPKNWQPPPRS